MFTFLLVIIYFAFISLGLPDSLLGTAWPVIQQELGMPLSAAGIISMTVSGGTIISSFMSGKMIAKFGTGKVTFVSVFMTAVALLGFSFTQHFWWLWICAIPLGLGAGAVDAALNNFVAIHYKARHMSWLHCFWGIGVSISPLIMSAYLAKEGGWKNGYLTVSIIQFVLVGILLFSLPAWKKVEAPQKSEAEKSKPVPFKTMFKLPVVKMTLLTFFAYCAMEATTGLWGSTYLVKTKGMAPESAAKLVSLYFVGITAGRFISGFAAIKMSGRTMIRIGECFIVLGIVLVLQPFLLPLTTIGFALIGLGCAPVYPAMIHDTPNRVGVEMSGSLMGVQMAFAYVGSTFMPPIYGLIAEKITPSVFPVYLLLFLIIMIIAVEVTYKLQTKRLNELEAKQM